MEDLKEPTAAAAATPVRPARPRRRWGRIVLYVLATVGVLALALIALAYYLNAKEAHKRVTIDEAAVIDSVMGETYGKYSAAKKGWLYVGDEDVTYLMRVVQQAKIPDGADGDELYFVASGNDVNGGTNALYGVFYVHPNGKAGLAQENTQIRYPSTTAIRPEQVRFEALSENLWGWVVKTRDDADPGYPVTTTNTVLAPHDGQIAVLAEFIAGRDAVPDESCEDAKKAWDDWEALMAQAREDESIDGTEPPTRCDKRRWTYRTATVNGNIPVPITVTAGGTLDGKPVEARSWKLMFDPKSFTYTIPDDLKEQ